MKKIIKLLALLLIFTTSTPTQASNININNHAIRLNPNGTITAGGIPIELPPELGSFHINNNGVAVLPARAILSIMFGVHPHDAQLFLWDDANSTFIMDPYGYNIRIQVGSDVLEVRGVQKQILSGIGEDAFVYAAYIEHLDGILYVPVRAIAEAVGFYVSLDYVTLEVVLTPSGR